MALPANITPVVVNGTYVGDDGTAATGTVTFSVSKATWLDDTGAGSLAIILPTPVIGTLDASGHLLDPGGTTGVKLIPTNATAVAPTAFTYDVTENLLVTVAGHAYPFTRTYTISAPSGSAIDLANVAPVAPTGPGALRVVLSVNSVLPDSTGAVTLTASDIGAISQSAADARYDAIGAAATETTRAEAAEALLLPRSDASVTNARTPTAHASTHAAGGTDPITPAAIGAVAVTAPQALTDAPTIATNAALGNHFRVTLGGNRTLDNPSGAIDGQKILWEISQDGTGGRTITLGSRFKLGTDIAAVVLSTPAAAKDFLGAVYNSGANFWYVIAFSKGY